MLIESKFIPAKPRVYRKKPIGATDVSQGPSLASATYDSTELILVLAFQSAVNVAGFDGSAFIINDPTVHNQTFLGTGGVQVLSAEIIQIMLEPSGPATGPQTVLNVTGSNGITSESGASWSGVVDYPVG